MSHNNNHYWIQKGTAHNKGRFTRLCKREGYGGASAACIAKERHSNDPRIRHEANLARVLKHLHHGGRRKKSGR